MMKNTTMMKDQFEMFKRTNLYNRRFNDFVAE